MNVKYRLTALFMAVVMLLSVCLAAVAEDVDGSITKPEYDANLDAALDVFYAQLMAAETYDEFSALISRMSQDQLNTIAAMFSDEYNASLNAKVADLLSAYMTDEGQEVEEEEPFVSEILYVTVPYTRVAAFKAPVVGTSNSKARTMAVSSASYALTPRATGTNDNNGLELSKSVVQNADGSYTLTLEAYATGEKVITEVKEDVPTDIVLVLDQSGSMTENMNTYGFRAYSGKTNEDYYALRHNGGSSNLYYQLEDGGYASVAVSVEEGTSKADYVEIADQSNYYYNWNQDNIYAKVGGEYQKVTVSYAWSDINRVYTYRLPDGTTICTSNGSNSSPSFDNAKSNGIIDDACLYLYTDTVDTTENIYTYQYTDSNGVTQTIGTSTGASTQPTGFTLYERYQAGSTRLDALKVAVTTFVNSVNAKAAGVDGVLGTTDDINHRIAIVGFGSESGNGNNTELLSIKGSNSGSVGVKYSSSLTTQQYKDVLQDMNTSNGQTIVNNAIKALAAEGATRSDLGMIMAKNVFAANPIPTDETRYRVVVMFTDGVPTTYSDFDNTVANDAVTNANTCKNTYEATVYAVGIFEGADATSAGSANGNDTQKANRFMQRLSSNNGTPQTPSYYLSAADASDLNSIFKQIADNIESGGSSSTLDETAVVRDIIAPSFTLPKNADKSSIKVYAAEYQNGGVFADKVAYDAGMVSITTDENDVTSIDVSGFNFSENWVGTVTDAKGNVTYRGKKLIIEIPIVMREGFLGGNNVPTNGDNSGVYSGTTCIENFEMPHVNVPIKDITVVAQDKNVYLLGGLTADELKTGASAKCGNVPINLDPKASNFGLESWQNKYVNITTNLTTESGVAITTLENMTEDTTFTLNCTIAPSKAAADGSVGDAASEKFGSDSASINVFKPEVTYKDSMVQYREPVPDIDAYHAKNNFVEVAWKHGDTVADTTVMGNAPALTYTYMPEPTLWVTAGKVTSTQDVKVNVTFAINNTPVTDYTTTVRQACSFEKVDCEHTDVTSDLAGAHTPEFVVHVYDVLTSLTITKEGMDDIDAGQSFLFRVTGDNLPTGGLLIAINGNSSETISGLLVGSEYTVVEEESWSWRYTDQDKGHKITLKVSADENKVTVNNTRDQAYWLDGDCYAENVFNAQGTGN